MKDYTQDKRFWSRLKMFVQDVRVNCLAGEEEKQMILLFCDKKINSLGHDTIENRKTNFTFQVSSYKTKDNEQLLQEFIDYWTEHGPRDRKMRFEKEKSFDIARRIKTWTKNHEKYEADRNANKKGFGSNTTRDTIQSITERLAGKSQ